MTMLEQWFLRRLIAKEVVQGPLHRRNITNLYAMIREACELEFREDNEPTLSSFLSDCFERTQRWPFGKPKEPA